MTYRQIHIEIWDDDWMLDLEPMEKLLFVYLFSNSRTHMIGLYEASWQKAAFETGLEPEFIEATLQKFEAAGKLYVDGIWIWIKNMLVRNVNNLRSPKVQKGIERHIRNVPNSCPFKRAWIEHYNTVTAVQYDIPSISYDTISCHRDTVPPPQIYSVSATATVPDPVSVSLPLSDPAEVEVSSNDEPQAESRAFTAFLRIRGGTINSVMVDQLGDLIDEAEKHRQGLPRGSPGADLSGDDWVADAIMVANAATNTGIVGINFIEAILKRWFAEGYKSPKKSRASPDAKHWSEFTEGEYAEFFQEAPP